MRLRIVFTSFLILGAIYTQGQKKLLYQASGDIIQKGDKAFLKNEYEASANYFRKVHPSDTNYEIAQTKLANSLYYLKKYTETIKIIDDLQANSGNLSAQNLITLGKSYQATGNTENALETINSGILRFPMNHLLFFSRGELFQELNEDQKAIQSFQDALKRNVFHSLSHLKLAVYAKKKGEISKAMMALNLYLMIVPGGDIEELIQYNEYLQSPASGKKVNWSLSNEDFSSIDEMTASLGSLSKKFKTPNKLTAPIAKQNYLLLSEIQNLPRQDGFWNEFYIPFYQQLMNDKKFNGFIYYMLRNVQSKELTAALKQNISLIEAFPDYAGPLWQMKHNIQKSMFEGEIQDVNYFWGNNQSVSGRGIFIDNEPVGKFEYYHPNGALSAQGYYSEDGEQDGVWTYYYENGNRSEKKTMDDGDPTGTDSLYFENGKLKTTQEYKSDGSLFVGSYFITGKLKNELQFVDDELHGPGVFYTSTGQKDYETTFMNDQANGAYVSYYDNGQIMDSLFFENGLKSGKAVEYHRNGSKKGEYTYLNGELNGTITEWFNTGAIRVEAAFENGELIGTRKEYYPNGTLRFESTYEQKKSKITYYSEYDEDGKLNLKLTYKKDELISYEVFNTDGESIEAKQKLEDIFQYNSFYTNGEPKTQGEYSTLNGGKNGDWKEYNKNGILMSSTPYEGGKINGEQTEYYSSGTKHMVTPYSNNLFNGLYKEYYQNGKLYEQGYYINGIAEGQWISYYSNGAVSTESFFVLGELNGTQNHFAVNGKLDYSKTYKNGILLSYAMCDTNESIIHSSRISNKVSKYEYRYPNGDLLREFHFTGNSFHGPSVSYYPSGQIMATGNYVSNNLDGKWTWYYPDGQIEKEGHYFAGVKTGIWKKYFYNGQLKIKETYTNGLNEGVYHQYYKSGELETELQYSLGKKHGTCKYFNATGDLQQIRNYKHGIWTSYSYTGKDGKLVTPIPVHKETVQCTSFYSNGNKSKEFGMVNGNFEGTYFDYYSNGQIQSQVNFVANMTNGPLISYYENGTLESEIPYTDNAKHGTAKYYNSEGVLLRTEEYLMGSLHGKTIIYSNGKPSKTLVFYNNDLISK